jgi:hypothetical protein
MAFRYICQCFRGGEGVGEAKEEEEEEEEEDEEEEEENRVDRY